MSRMLNGLWGGGALSLVDKGTGEGNVKYFSFFFWPDPFLI